MQDRSAGHTELNIDLAETLSSVKLPLLFAVDVVAGQYTCAKETPDMFTIVDGDGEAELPSPARAS